MNWPQAFLLTVFMLLVTFYLPNCMKRNTCGLPDIAACQHFCGATGVIAFETPSVAFCKPKSLSRCQCND